MRVLHVIPSLSQHDGGPSQAILLMQRSLALHGITIDIATTDDDGPGRCLQEIPIDPRRFYFRKRCQFYKVAPAFVSWIERHVRDYDVIHIHAMFSFVCVVAARAAARAGVPFIIRPLGTLNRYGIEQRRPWLKQLSLRWVDGPLLRKAAAVHFTAVAEQQEAELLNIPLRGVVVPLGLENFMPADASVLAREFPLLTNRRFLLFLSRLDPKKNIESLLQAFATLVHAQPDTMLVIAGNGETSYVNGLKVLTTTLGIQNRVLWTGFVVGERKAALLGEAALFVLPSYSENFGIAAAEALMAGLPCVLGEGVALAAQVVAAGAGIAVAPTSGPIAAGLSSVLAQPIQRQAMAENGRRLAEAEYSLAAMGQQLMKLYQRLCAK